MSIVALYIQQANGPDDVITFNRAPGVAGVFEVTFKPNDLPKTTYKFYMTLQECEDYLYRTLKLLSLDTNPFSHIQVTTRMTPSVIFEIPDLDDTYLREAIEKTVLTALRTAPRVLVE